MKRWYYINWRPAVGWAIPLCLLYGCIGHHLIETALVLFSSLDKDQLPEYDATALIGAAIAGVASILGRTAEKITGEERNNGDT